MSVSAIHTITMDREQVQKSSMANQSSQDRSKQRSGKLKRARSVMELLSGVLEPVLARRTGMRLDLVRAWPEIAGEEFGDTTRPEKIDWPRRIHEENSFEPATLVVACEPSSALFFQHEQAAILERVNVFFGFQAIKRVRIVQKPVKLEPAAPVELAPEPLSKVDKVKLSGLLEEIDDPELRDVLARLGSGVLHRGN